MPCVIKKSGVFWTRFLFKDQSQKTKVETQKLKVRRQKLTLMTVVDVWLGLESGDKTWKSKIKSQKLQVKREKFKVKS